VRIAAQAIQLRDSEARVVQAAQAQRLGQLGPVRPRAALDLDHFGHELPGATVQVVGHRLALRLQPKAAVTLAVDTCRYDTNRPSAVAPSRSSVTSTATFVRCYKGTRPEKGSRVPLPMRTLDGARALGHAGAMRTAILAASLLSIAPAIAQEAPLVWRDPDGGCTYLKLRDTLSLRYQRDGLPDCPNARRETNSPSMPPADQAEPVTRDDVHDVTRAIESLSRKVDDLRREYERRGRF
jgi:hypothetical protein